MRKIENKYIFLILVGMIYLILFIVNKSVFDSSLGYFSNLLVKIIPIFFLVFVLMSIMNYFFTPKFVAKHLREKGIKKWFFVVIGGILSTGAIYMWYPLLADLKSKGLNYGLISCFLYNRAIKIPLLPLMVFYFSLKYVIVLGVVMVIMSVVQGIIINKLMGSEQSSGLARPSVVKREVKK